MTMIEDDYDDDDNGGGGDDDDDDDDDGDDDDGDDDDMGVYLHGNDVTESGEFDWYLVPLGISPSSWGHLPKAAGGR